MSFASRRALLAAGLVCLAAAAPARELRVCSDPDNLPLSHENGGGFENRIAHVVADEMGAELRYEWMPLRRGFVRKTMGSGSCDVLIGVPKTFGPVLTTRAYYRSSYVFVDGPAAQGIDTFDDPRLRHLRVGVQLVGNDLAATPVGHALTMNGHVNNVQGFTIFGDGPASQRMIDAITARTLDTALVWGPQAGYFAARAAPRPELRVARAPVDLANVPFEFDIAMGVRRGDIALRDELDSILERRRTDIDAILSAYSVPRTDGPREERP
jgi:mxaJ protein